MMMLLLCSDIVLTQPPIFAGEKLKSRVPSGLSLNTTFDPRVFGGGGTVSAIRILPSGCKVSRDGLFVTTIKLPSIEPSEFKRKRFGKVMLFVPSRYIPAIRTLPSGCTLATEIGL